MVNSKQQILSLISDHQDAIKEFGISRVGLSGSFIRNEQQADSDVDMLVEFEVNKKNYRNLLGFSDLTEKLFDRPVEVVTRQSLSPFISTHIDHKIEYIQIN